MADLTLEERKEWERLARKDARIGLGKKELKTLLRLDARLRASRGAADPQ